MKLDLRLLEVPLGDLWCEAVAALVFDEPFDSQEPILSLDAKMGGYLNYLRESGFWTGAAGSSVLVATQKKINADKILLMGLGPNADCTAKIFRGCVADLGLSLAMLRIHDLAVWIPPPRNPNRCTPAHFRNSCSTLLKSYMKKLGSESDCFLKVVFPVPRALLGRLNEVARQLKEEFTYLQSCTVIAPLGERRKPPGLQEKTAAGP